MTNMRNIAKLAGVSVATVSRILNHDSDFRVSEKTKNKVRQITQNLHYNKNESAKHKRKHTGIKFGLITRHNRMEVNSDPYFVGLRKGIISEAAKWNIEIDNLFDARKPPKSLTFLSNYNLILLLNNPTFAYIQEVKKYNRNLIVVDYFGVNNQINVVHNDFYEQTIAILNLLKERGHRNISFIGGYNSLINIDGQVQREKNEVRMTAYQKWMKLNNLNKYAHPYISKWVSEGGYHSAKTLLKRKQLPTAVVVASDPLALGVYKAFKQADIKIPGDISVVSFDDIDEAKFLTPSLSSVHLNAEEMGKMTIDLGKQVITNKWETPVTLICKSKLRLRDSVSDN